MATLVPAEMLYEPYYFIKNKIGKNIPRKSNITPYVDRKKNSFFLPLKPILRKYINMHNFFNKTIFPMYSSTSKKKPKI